MTDEKMMVAILRGLARSPLPNRIVAMLCELAAAKAPLSSTDVGDALNLTSGGLPWRDLISAGLVEVDKKGRRWPVYRITPHGRRELRNILAAIKGEILKQPG